MSFQEESSDQQSGVKKRSRWLVWILAVALAVSATGVFVFRDHFWGARADARAAVKALKGGDLVTLENHLAANRGKQDFAYFFTSQVTPRDLGDALATVASSSADDPLKPDIDTHAYELTLTDLAGTLATATHGIGDRALPVSWTTDFIAATTDPLTLYGEHNGFFDQEGKLREKQDEANRSNLLLLLSRGYWSSDFLKAVTESYYEFDLHEGDKAWPDASPSDEVGYAPAPSGVYLTDGILALTAALTANPFASEWAFTDFLPDNVEIKGTEYSIGEFTHFLMFEHQFPESDGESVGTTAVLTALSSAIESANWAADPDAPAPSEALLSGLGPMHDSGVLQALANDLKDLGKKSQCSWNPLDYGNCVAETVKVVWEWILRWGHLVLDILTLATFAPPPFNAIGIAAAVTNATWHTIEGDYAIAGLSLAAAVPGLAFVKIAKSVKVGPAAQKIAANSDEVAKAAKAHQAGTPVTLAQKRINPSEATKAEIRAAAPTDNGDFIDPNTGKIIPREGPYDIGHKRGHEWRCIVEKAVREGWTVDQLKKYVNNPSLYQIEDPSSNRSHKYEAEKCER